MSSSSEPPPLTRQRGLWQTEYIDEVELLYESYLEVGRAIFGGAFHQTGSLADFANFVFRHMQPGAT